MSSRSITIALAAAGAAVVGACLRPAVFGCESSASCLSAGIRGVCEPSGYCSYPSDACASGQAYDEFAGGGLANACVESGTSGPALTSASDGGTHADTEACPPPARCEDLDGDGYGEGEDCLGADCDDDNPSHHDACVYISPEGDDAGAGSRDAPWRTFDRAIRALGPGQSLVLLAGTYTLETTGLPRVDCGAEGNAAVGTAEAPISIRAEREREPLLQGNGSAALVGLIGCRHWRLHGLRGRDADAPGGGAGVGEQGFSVDIRESEDIVVRRMLMSHPNRYYNSQLYGVLFSRRVWIEESEAYFFHREGFFLTNSEDVTVRRCYARANDYPDLPDCVSGFEPELPLCTGTPLSGDTGFSMYREVTRSRIENCVSDGPLGQGFSIGSANHDNLIAGSIALDVGTGIAINNSEGPAERNAIVDCVAVDVSSNAVTLSSTTETSVDGLTTVGAAGVGLLARQTEDCALVPGGCSVDALRVLALRSMGSGVVVEAHDPWRVSDSNAFGNGGQQFDVAEDIGDDQGNVRASTSIDAGAVGRAPGQCLVFIPDGSPMKGAGAGGADIGATVLRRHEDELTSTPLWDPQTGAFPCGAVIPGSNDAPQAACGDVHERLNVGTNGCTLPPDYGVVEDPCG